MPAITAYPLSWPLAFPRTKIRERSRFQSTLPAALKNVQTSLRLFGQDSGKTVGNIIISSNYSLGDERPTDGGVAVYFTWDGLNVCIPIDRYFRLEENLQAVHHIIEARRVELRHGTLQLVRASMTGFIALPPPSSQKPWWEILEIPQAAPVDEINSAFRRLAAKHHPDQGGSTDTMAQINRARSEALRAKGA